MKTREVVTVSEHVLKQSKSLLEIKDGNEFNSVNNNNSEFEYKYPVKKEGYKKWMKDMMLSPRGLYTEPNQCIKVNDKRARKGYVVCSCCRYALQRGNMHFL